MTREPVRPRDVLPDGVDGFEIGGLTARKGTVAAFIANVRLLDELHGDADGRQAVIAQIRALVPTMRAIGLFEVFEPKSEQVRSIVAQV